MQRSAIKICTLSTLSSAFNTIDHDKLLCIMHDLGFPPDAIEVVSTVTLTSSTMLQVVAYQMSVLARDVMALPAGRLFRRGLYMSDGYWGRK